MKRIISYVGSVVFILFLTQCKQGTTAIQSQNNPPTWSEDAIWYQIMVERFRNGDTSNDPNAESLKGTYPHEEIASWKLTPWTQQWYKPDPWFGNLSDSSFYNCVSARRYGGDLAGVFEKLDYLAQLGITAIYFNPLNDAPSMHKYDAASYHHIDRHFGPNPALDAALMKAENPGDPSTWKWTTADSLFLQLIDACHQRSIRVVLDYSWNHTGMNFWAFRDVMEKGAKSAYADWYEIESFDNPATSENEFRYTGWSHVRELPEFKRTITSEPPKYSVGYLEGNFDSKSLKQHIFDVSRRWLDPNGDGDPSDGIDGFRLDVAGEVPVGFWMEYRKVVKSINPEAILIGEIWWEQWPDRLLDPTPWLNIAFDAVMNYRWYRAARGFFGQQADALSPTQFVDQLKFLNQGIGEENQKAMMNMSSSHDSERLSTSLYNQGKYKDKVKISDNKDYKINKPDAATLQIQKMLLMHQYTYLGAPQIWAGDESGMWGEDDPSNRKPLVWEDLVYEAENIHPLLGNTAKSDAVEVDMELRTFYNNVIHLRLNRKELRSGDISFLIADDNAMLVAYSRKLNDQETICVFNLSFQEQMVELPVRTSKAYKNVFQSEMIFSGHADKLKISVPARAALVLVN